MDIRDTLKDRATTHGSYQVNACCAQDLKKIIWTHTSPGRVRIPAADYALEMFCNKIARIVAGNPMEPDHWRDIAGYATLVVDTLERIEKERKNVGVNS